MREVPGKKYRLEIAFVCPLRTHGDTVLLLIQTDIGNSLENQTGITAPIHYMINFTHSAKLFYIHFI